MLVGLIRGQKTDRVFEKTGEYGSEDKNLKSGLGLVGADFWRVVQRWE